MFAGFSVFTGVVCAGITVAAGAGVMAVVGVTVGVAAAGCSTVEGAGAVVAVGTSASAGSAAGWAGESISTSLPCICGYV